MNTKFVSYRSWLWLVCAVGLSGMTASATVKVAGVFGSNMVLQRDMAVPVWGWADKGENVSVEFNGVTKGAVADETGKWSVTLGPFPAGGPFTMAVKGSNAVTLSNILVGEVWICSGQSNMQWGVKQMENGEAEIAGANHPEMRLATIHGTAMEPAKDLPPLTWVECSPATVPGFSAPGYFFGRELLQAIKVPIGLINTSEGSSPIRAWISPEVQRTHPSFKDALEEYKTFPERAKAHADAIAKAKAEGKPPPSHVPFYEAYTNGPGFLYNARIHPLAPLAMRGVLWYQGENEALFRHGRIYREQFPLLIADWRKLWGEGDFPFLYVQIAPFGAPPPGPVESQWAEVRDGQRRTLALPNTAMVVTTDICEPELHPRKKVELGKRLALAARAVAYGEKQEYSGPLFAKAEFKDGKAILSFTHANGGLVAKGGKLEGFAIAGADGEFVLADAEISQDKVIVHSDKVPTPQVVRYAWADCPRGNLFNQEGLPASCFRTDE